MDIYRYTNSTITNDCNRLTVKISSESKHDNAYLESIIVQINDREALRKRIEYLLKSSEFNKVHNHQAGISEVTAELDAIRKNFDKVKRSWAYRILNFISLR